MSVEFTTMADWLKKRTVSEVPGSPFAGSAITPAPNCPIASSFSGAGDWSDCGQVLLQTPTMQLGSSDSEGFDVKTQYSSASSSPQLAVVVTEVYSPTVVGAGNSPTSWELQCAMSNSTTHTSNSLESILRCEPHLSNLQSIVFGFHCFAQLDFPLPKSRTLEQCQRFLVLARRVSETRDSFGSQRFAVHSLLSSAAEGRCLGNSGEPEAMNKLNLPRLFGMGGAHY